MFIKVLSVCGSILAVVITAAIVLGVIHTIAVIMSMRNEDK